MWWNDWSTNLSFNDPKVTQAFAFTKAWPVLEHKAENNEHRWSQTNSVPHWVFIKVSTCFSPAEEDRPIKHLIQPSPGVCVSVQQSSTTVMDHPVCRWQRSFWGTPASWFTCWSTHMPNSQRTSLTMQARYRETDGLFQFEDLLLWSSVNESTIGTYFLLLKYKVFLIRLNHYFIIFNVGFTIVRITRKWSKRHKHLHRSKNACKNTRKEILWKRLQHFPQPWSGPSSC